MTQHLWKRGVRARLRGEKWQCQTVGSPQEASPDPSYSRSRIWLPAVKKCLLTSPDPTFHNEDLQEVECEGVLERIER